MTNYAYDFAPKNGVSQPALAAGVGVAVCRYLKKDLPNSYDMDKTERDKYFSWGLGVLYNAEQGATDLTTQSPQYFKNYGKMLSDKLQSWGVNPRFNVPLSADGSISGTAMTTALNNYAAFASTIEPFGVVGYAQTQLIDKLLSSGISRPGSKHWLPGAISWSGLPNTSAGWAKYMAYPNAGICQMLGSNVAGTDMNYLLPGWNTMFDWPAGSPYAPAITTQEDDEDNMFGWYVSTIDPDGNTPKTYIIDHDLKSKLHLIDPDADAAIVAITKAMPTYNTTPSGAAGPGQGYVTVSWPWSLVNSIPDVGAAPAINVVASVAIPPQKFSGEISNA